MESGVLSLEKQHKVVRLKDNYDTKHYVSIDFVFQPTFCCVDGCLLVIKEPGQEVAVVAAMWSLESGVGAGTSHPHPSCHQQVNV